MASMICVNCGNGFDVTHQLKDLPAPSGGTVIFGGSMYSAYVDDGNVGIIRCPECEQGHRVMIPKEYRK